MWSFILVLSLIISSITSLQADPLKAPVRTEIVSQSDEGVILLPQAFKMPVSDLATPFVAVVGDSLYILGGHLGDQHIYHPWNFTRSSWRVDLRDEEFRWVKLADRPTSSMGSNGTGVWKNQIFTFGGFGNSWSGGEYNDSLDPRVNARYWASFDTVDVFDVASETWFSLENSGFPARSSAGVAQLGSRVYFVGGWDAAQSEHFFHEVSYFDMEELKYVDTDVLVPEPLDRRALIAVTVSESEFVIAGGLGTEREAWLFNIEQETWTKLADLPFGVTNAQLASVDGRVLLVGGSHRDPLGRNVFEYDSESNEWVDLGLQLHRRKASARLVTLNNGDVLVLGGYVRNGKDDPFIPTQEGREFGQSPVEEVEILRLKP